MKKCKLLNCVAKWMLAAGLINGILIVLLVLIVAILSELEIMTWFEDMKIINMWLSVTALDIILSGLLYIAANWNQIRKDMKCG